MSAGQKGSGCEGCKFLMREDGGYSNYTVMDTTVTCLKGVNPSLPLRDDVETATFDAALAFGESCPVRVAGDGPWYDVDGETTDEEACGNDAELLALVKSTRGRS